MGGEALPGRGLDEAVGLGLLESEHRAREAQRLQDLFEEAARTAWGQEGAHILQMPKERVRPRPTSAVRCGSDLWCHAPATAWRRHLLGQLRLKRAFQGPRHLAEALVEQLPPQTLAGGLRVAADGAIHIATQLHLRRMRAEGFVACPDCGAFQRGQRGMRDHFQRVHANNDYEQAIQAATAACAALVPVDRRFEIMHRHWLVARAAEDARRKELPRALHFAKEGALSQLIELATSEGWASIRGARDRHGSTAVHWAAGCGHLSVCQLLCDVGQLPADEGQQCDGRTPLHWAARNGRLGVARWLVQHKAADVNRGTNDGTTALHWAVWQGHLGMCKYLVKEAGANLHARNAYGCNALQWAAQSDNSKGLRMCRWLQAEGLDMHLVNRNGHSALHKAAVKGNRDVCEWLLSDEVGLGKDHMRADSDGNTPASMAQAEGFAELALWLRGFEGSE